MGYAGDVDWFYSRKEWTGRYCDFYVSIQKIKNESGENIFAWTIAGKGSPPRAGSARHFEQAAQDAIRAIDRIQIPA
jgi:hypothetical protein